MLAEPALVSMSGCGRGSGSGSATAVARAQGAAASAAVAAGSGRQWHEGADGGVCQRQVPCDGHISTAKGGTVLNG